MELRHLRYFVAVAEELHFGRAASRIGIEQSPLSRAIRELEDDLGVRLFQRTSRGTTLTAAGKMLQEDAPRILTEISHARACAQSASQARHRRLRVGFSDSIAQNRLSEVLHLTRLQEPELLLLVADSKPPHMRDLHAGWLDLVLSPVPAREEGINSHALWSDPLVAIVPHDHRYAAGTTIAASELKQYSGWSCHPELLYAHQALELALTVHTVASRSILVEMVASGLAVGILLAGQAETLQRPDIRIVPFDDREFGVTTYALCRGDPLSEPCARFLDRTRKRGVPQSFGQPSAF
jgi:DNA-binding transcriptional LysR family regulator